MTEILSKRMEHASDRHREIGGIISPGVVLAWAGEVEILEARAEALEGFWRDMVQVFGFDGSLNLDGGDFEEMAEKRGLIKWVTYNPEDFTEAEREHIEVEPGDQMWVPVERDALAAREVKP